MYCILRVGIIFLVYGNPAHLKEPFDADFAELDFLELDDVLLDELLSLELDSSS